MKWHISQRDFDRLHKRVTPEVEQILLEQVQYAEDATEYFDARSALVQNNIAFAIWIVRRRLPKMYWSEFRDDIIAASYIGLIAAADKFSWSKSPKGRDGSFRTYAYYWCLQCCQLEANKQLVWLSGYDKAKTHSTQIGKAIQRLRHKLEREPTDFEVSCEFDVGEIDPRDVAKYRSIASRIDKNWENSTQSERSRELRELYESTLQQTPPELDPSVLVENKELNGLLRDQIKRLGPRWAEVIRRRYGLVDGVAETLEEIGADLNITRERVRQIQNQALKRLGEIMEVSRYKEFLEDG